MDQQILVYPYSGILFFKEERKELLTIYNNGPQRYSYRCDSTHFLEQAINVVMTEIRPRLTLGVVVTDWERA